MSTINIRESLRQLDDDSFCKYDLLTMYDSCPLLDEDKQEIAKLLYNKEDPEVIYQKLCAYFCDDDTSEIDTFNDFVQPGTFEIIVDECVNRLKENCSDAQYNDVASQLEVIKDGELYTTGLAPIEIETGDIEIFVDGNYDSPLAFDSTEDAVNYITDVVLNKLTSTSVDSGDDDVMVYTVYDIVEDDDNRLTAKCMNESTNDFQDIKLGKVNSLKVNELLNNMLNNPNYKITDEVKKKIYDKSAPWGLAVQMTSAVDVDGTNGLLSTGDFGGEASFGESIETNFEKDDRVTDGDRQGTVLDYDNQKVLVEWDYSQTDDIEWVDKSELSFVECLKESGIPMDTVKKDIESYLNYHLGSNEDYIKVNDIQNIDKDTIAVEYEVHLSIPIGNDEYESDTEYRSLAFRYRNGKWEPKLEESLQETDEDGWGDRVEQILEPTIEKVEDLAYEVRNTVRGANTNCDTTDELADYVDEVIEDFEDANSSLRHEAKEIDESKSINEDALDDQGISKTKVDIIAKQAPNSKFYIDKNRYVLGKDLLDYFNTNEILTYSSYETSDGIRVLNSYKIINRVVDESINEDLIELNFSSFNELRKQYKNYTTFKDKEKNSELIRDLCDQLENKKVSYNIYNHKKDNGMTIFYDDCELVESTKVDSEELEAIVNGLDENGYNLNVLSSIKEGLWALFGYQGKDAFDVVEELVTKGYIDSNVLIDAGYTPTSLINESLSPYKKEEFKKQLQDELYDKFIDLARTPEWGFENLAEIGDYLIPTIEVNDYEGEYDNDIEVEFRAEVNYREMEDVCNTLDKVVNKYDKNAYFEPVQPGIAVAYLKFPKKLKEDFEDDEIVTGEQEFDSAATSINSSKLPAVYRMVDFTPGQVVIDFGGGKFDNAVNYLKDKDVTLLVYDPYNRSAEHNKEVLRVIRENGGADAAINSNVLNVIKEPEARQQVLKNIKKLVKPGAPIYITVYEGSGKGNEGPTKAGYQLNRKTSRYIDEISQIFPNVKRRGKLITAINESFSSSGLRQANIDAIDYFMEFEDIYTFPKGKFLASDWEELRDGTLMGMDDDLEIAEGIMEYLQLEIDFNNKHKEIYEDDPQAELTLEIYNKVKKEYEKTISKMELSETLSDRIKNNELDYDEEIDAYFAEEDNIYVQFQDRQTNTYRSTLDPKDNRMKIVDRNPRVSSNTWARIWKDGELVKSFEGPKYKVRADVIKYLDDNNKSEVLEETSYGGAFDIEDDQYFTKEEIVDVAEKVCEHLDETYPDNFDIADVYMETPTIIHVEVISKEGNWASANAKIDMRKIKKPSDIMKYDVVIGDLVYNLRQELEDLYKA